MALVDSSLGVVTQLTGQLEESQASADIALSQHYTKQPAHSLRPY